MDAHTIYTTLHHRCTSSLRELAGSGPTTSTPNQKCTEPPVIVVALARLLAAQAIPPHVSGPTGVSTSPARHHGFPTSTRARSHLQSTVHSSCGHVPGREETITATPLRQTWARRVISALALTGSECICCCMRACTNWRDTGASTGNASTTSASSLP